MSLYFRFLRWLHQFEEQPRYFRPLAGLYVMLWARYCGHDWRFAWRMGLIYWWPKDREEAQCEAIMQASDTMILAECRAEGVDPADVKKRVMASFEKAKAQVRASSNGLEKP